MLADFAPKTYRPTLRLDRVALAVMAAVLFLIALADLAGGAA
jgi:hypothetical protein